MRSLTLVILKLMPQILDSVRPFLSYFPIFVTFCRNAPPCGDLEKISLYHLLDHDLFYICTKFHSNWPKNIELALTNYLWSMSTYSGLV